MEYAIQDEGVAEFCRFYLDRRKQELEAAGMDPKYEEQFTAFVDFLGFSEVSSRTADTTRQKILDLLLALSALRGEFDVQSAVNETGKTTTIKPAISTFSDHIVISFPLEPIYKDAGFDEHIGAFIILNQFNSLLSRLAAAALRIGFLIRGGATIGNLYHSSGVVFGEALIEAFQIESRTSVYPRVVVSSQITRRSKWIENQPYVVRGTDGLYHFDYFKTLLLSASLPGENFAKNTKEWINHIVPLIARNLTELEKAGKLKEFSKWAWFARHLRDGIGRLPAGLLQSFGVLPDIIPVPK